LPIKIFVCLRSLERNTPIVIGVNLKKVACLIPSYMNLWEAKEMMKLPKILSLFIKFPNMLALIKFTLPLFRKVVQKIFVSFSLFL